MIKINMTYDCIVLQKPLISAIIRKCVETTLAAEGVTVPCEINVLVTNDKGIRAINQACRGIDKATDVLSFPMFQLEAGNPPADWEGYMDPDTNIPSYCFSIGECEGFALGPPINTLRFRLYSISASWRRIS